MVVGSNDTLGKLPGNYRLHFNCSNSLGYHFNKRLDVDALIKHLGENFVSTELYGVLRCPECKSKKFLVIATPVHFSYPAGDK